MTYFYFILCLYSVKPFNKKELGVFKENVSNLEDLAADMDWLVETKFPLLKTS